MNKQYLQFSISILILAFSLKLVADSHTVNIVTEELYPLSYSNSNTNEIQGLSTDIIRRRIWCGKSSNEFICRTPQ